MDLFGFDQLSDRMDAARDAISCMSRSLNDANRSIECLQRSEERNLKTIKMLNDQMMALKMHFNIEFEVVPETTKVLDWNKKSK